MTSKGTTRRESSVLSVSWLPSEAVRGLPRIPFNLGITHYDDPPPDVIAGSASVIAGRTTTLSGPGNRRRRLGAGPIRVVDLPSALAQQLLPE